MSHKKRLDIDSGILVWDCGSPLYDSYEIASFGHLIDRKMMAMALPPSPTGSNRFMDIGSSTSRGDDHHHQVKIHAALGDVGFFSRSFVGRRLPLADQDNNIEKAKKLMRRLFSGCGLCITIYYMYNYGESL
ncbi:hypothetical protein Ddye_002817 [Dipteronia dyeriana]|uniref:Uncharacterized protein n=1 Tax=Dipteronia dyeriana TaxID=168575 RepID=A0AAE0CVC5_9ROSI|nr:hypothetical protein Ddye_002817 [Dipteronia dyeriana]